MTRTQRTQAKPTQEPTQVTWQQKGCGMASTPSETARHQVYFAMFSDFQLDIYRLKLAGKRQEAVEKAAQYNAIVANGAPCICGCGQKVVF